MTNVKLTILPYVFSNFNNKPNEEVVVLKMHQLLVANLIGIPSKMEYQNEQTIVNYLLYLKKCMLNNAKYIESEIYPTINECILLGPSNEYTLRYLLNKIIELEMTEIIDFSFSKKSKTIKQCLEESINKNIPLYEFEYDNINKKYFSKDFCLFCEKYFDLVINKPLIQKNDFAIKNDLPKRVITEPFCFRGCFPCFFIKYLK